MPDIFQFGVDSENIDVHTLLYEWPDKLANSDQTVFPIDGEWHSLDEIVE